MLLESREFGCPTVRICPKKCSGAEPRAEPSDFRTIGQFGSARLSVGQPKILELGSAVGRTEQENLSECRPLEPTDSPTDHFRSWGGVVGVIYNP